jgi:hypothetical protein
MAAVLAIDEDHEEERRNSDAALDEIRSPRRRGGSHVFSMSPSGKRPGSNWSRGSAGFRRQGRNEIFAAKFPVLRESKTAPLATAF